MAKKIKKYKVAMASETFSISLVQNPAIEVDYVALSKQDEVEVKLSSDERHICYGPALIPNKDIYRNNGTEEFYLNFSEESIVKMSQEFMDEYRQHEIRLDHNTNADEVYVVESWIVEDPYRDKSNALGINVPKGTWMIGAKVNNVDVWERVKSGDLKGFSVESKIFKEEFGKQNDNNMNIETNEMFWDKLVNVLKETFSKKEDEVVEEPHVIEPTNIELEEEPQPVVEEPKPSEEPKVEEPVVEEPKPQEEPKPTEEPKPQEEPKDNHLEELVQSLKDEIAALKEMNSGLKKEIKNLGKQPSTDPIKPNGKPSNGDTYSAWREQMRRLI